VAGIIVATSRGGGQWKGGYWTLCRQLRHPLEATGGRNCVLELFGGIGSGLVAVLQVGLKLKRYIYVDVDEAARQVAKRHSQRLRIQFPKLLATSTIKTSFSTLVGDIALVSAQDIYRCGHVDLVIAGWPYQGMSMAGKQNGLQNGRSSRFHDMIRVMCYLQTSQRQPPTLWRTCW
jgi:site-specific DNA-cytosine methylase